MNNGFNYHVPVGRRSYRIGRSIGINAYLQRCWPHHQHRFLAYMCYKTIGVDSEIVTQKELIDEFDLNKGVVSATLSKMLKRKHIEKISKTRPFWYRLTLGGEQYGRYIFTHFPKYHLDIFHYFDLTRIKNENLQCIKQSRSLTDKVEKIHGPTLFSVSLKVRLLDLSCEIPGEFMQLCVKLRGMGPEERKEMFRTRNCGELTGLYQLLEEEWRIRYILTTLIKMDEIYNEIKGEVNPLESRAIYEDYIHDILWKDYSKPFQEDFPRTPTEAEKPPENVQVSTWDWGIKFLEDMNSIMELFSPSKNVIDMSEVEHSNEMEHRLKRMDFILEESKRRRRKRRR